MNELIASLDSEIQTDFWDLYEDSRSSREDKLRELADGWVPDNHHELADLLAADNSLASPDDFEMENATVWDFIQASVRERLQTNATLEYANQEEAFDDMKDTLEGMGYQVSYHKDKETKVKNWYIYLDEEDEEGSIVKDGFKNEYEAWVWLEANEAQLPE